MLPAVLSTYGGPYQDQEVVEDATSQVASEYFNKVLLDETQLTRTCWRAMVLFQTTTAPPPATSNPLGTVTVWGSGVALWPTVTKTATGLYVIAFASSYLDELGATEVVEFTYVGVSLVSDLWGFINGRPITSTDLQVHIADTTGVASDLGGGARVVLWCR